MYSVYSNALFKKARVPNKKPPNTISLKKLAQVPENNIEQ